jgi:hypothetical protein
MRRQNLESRAKERALNKVPLLKSSPDGRGEEAANSFAKVSFGRGSNRLTFDVTLGGRLCGAR